MAHQWIATGPGGLDVLSFEQFDVPGPRPGEVTIVARAAGMNPADVKHVASGAGDFPRPIGYEVAGVLTAIGPDTEIASGPATVGDEVLAIRIGGGWATDLTVPAADVFAKPPALSFGEAANLLLAGTTAAEMLTSPTWRRVTRSWCTARPGRSERACSSRPPGSAHG